MSIATVTDFKHFARTFIGRISIGTSESDTMTVVDVERYLSDAESELEIKYSCDASTLTGRIRNLFIALTCLSALRSSFVAISVSKDTTALIEAEIERITQSISPKVGIIMQDIDTAFETPFYLGTE